MGSREYDWRLDYGDIALLWRGGCIIRARFLEKIEQSFRGDPAPANLIQAQRDYFGAHTFQRVDRPGDFHHQWR